MKPTGVVTAALALAVVQLVGPAASPSTAWAQPPAADPKPAPDKPADDKKSRDADIFGAPEKPATPDKPADDKKPADTPAPAASSPRDADIFGAPAAADPKAPGTDTPAATAPAPGEPPSAAPMPPSDNSAPARTTDSPTPPPASGESARDADLLSDPNGASRLSQDAAPDDPLKIGGMFYLRTQATARQGDDPKDWAFSAPALLDVYMDARPNDRVRGFVLGRMAFDPTLPTGSAMASPMGMVGNDSGSGAMGTADLSSLFAGRTRGPTVALDQMWLRFDLGHTVFVTAGKQHARFGTARFWTPTDFLHIRRRNPLDVFDARTGTTMVKLHMPWEARGWNFYGYGVLEGENAIPTVGDIAGAARAEVVLGSTEIGADAMVQAGHKPKIGLDISTGIWDFDVYGEMALRYGSEIDRVTYIPAPVGPNGIAAGSFLDQYPNAIRNGVKAQTVAGLSYSRKYNDNDMFNVGLEYFYNPLGYDSPEAYPGLILPRSTPLRDPATFFYLGRQYGAIFVNVPAPYDWNYTTFTLSTLGNLSDQSFISRLDYSLTLLTHLRFEAYAAFHYGRKEGEFRFGVDNLTIDGRTYKIPPGLLDVGLALRVSL